MKDKIITGRPPRVKDIKKAKQLRNKGRLTYREIARAMEADVKTVYRWVQYPLAKR